MLQCIVFDQIGDLTACLRTMLADPDVEVLRVKNRFAARYDAEHTAGYRDVAVNLRVLAAALPSPAPGAESAAWEAESDQQTIPSPAAEHVCEVQLLLLPFMEAKCDSGHRRYIAYRNAMAF